MKKGRNRIKRLTLQPCCSFALGFCLVIAATNAFEIVSPDLYAASFHEQQGDLKKLQKRIHNLQKQIRKDTRLRDESQSLLETTERDIARTQKQIRSNNEKLAQSKVRMDELEKQQNQALGRMGKQQKQLAAMLKLAYQNQQTPALKLFLNESDPAKIGRQMVYYRYLMQAQETQVTTLTKQVRDYVELLEKASEEQAELQKLQQENVASLKNLELSREQRKTLVKQLGLNIKSQTGEVNKLAAEEKALNSIISELERTLESFPKNNQQAFKLLHGRLAWPVPGKILHYFGQYRIAGQKIRWRGVFIAAERDTEIRAVAYGRIVYADWLPGHGLITILDHGDNYLSLYANAEMLFKEVGAWVQAGEVIATIGDSGGNKTTGLYFEIRRGKSAQNPVPWFKTRSP